MAEEGIIEAMEARDRFLEQAEQENNLNKAAEDIENDKENPLKPEELTKIKKRLTNAKNKAASEKNKAASEYKKHVKTIKKGIAEELNRDPEVIKAMNGTKITSNDIKLEDYNKNADLELNDPMKHVNDYLSKKFQNLQSKLEKITGESITETIDKRKFYKKFMDKISNEISNMGKYEKLGLGLSLGLGIFNVIGAIVDGNKSTKQFANENTGCYQINVVTNEVVGPCRCGFKIPDQPQWDKCGNYDYGKSAYLQVGTLPFCKKNPDNSISVCSYTEGACKSYNKDIIDSGSCEIGKCQSIFCDKNSNDKSCKWVDDSYKSPDGSLNPNVKSFAICIDPSDFVLQMLHFNDTSSDWMPTPTPPLITLISIIGVLLMAITLIWYVLFLIRQERKMGKK